MYGILPKLLLILLLMLINGLFAMSEIAMVSVRKARLQQRADKGDRRSLAALDLAASPNRFLSTVQIGITLIGVLAGAYGGATIAPEIAAALTRIRPLAPYADALGLTIAVVGTAYLSLVIGELVPKRLALHYTEGIALAVARPMDILSRIASPIVSLLSASTDLVVRLLGVHSYSEPPVTEDEIRVLVEQGTIAGMIEEVERDMVARVFRLGERQVGALMMPRSEVVWLDLEEPLEEIRRVIESSSYSRFPVARDSLDDILGVVHLKDLLAQLMAGDSLDLKAALQQPLFVPESMQVFQVLELFKQAGVPVALVVDEYGIFQGLITLTDILEGIVGDIPKVNEIEEPMIVQREDGSWLLDGLLTVDEFKDLFELDELPDEEDYQTLGGFMVAQLGRIPTAGDHFLWNRLRLEVVDMDGNRVDKVLVSPVLDEDELSDI